MAISAGNVPADSDPQDLQHMDAPATHWSRTGGALHLGQTISRGFGVCKVL